MALRIDLNSVPVSIEAPSRNELTIKMFENNSKLKAKCEYFDIQKDGNKWVAWYYARINPNFKTNKIETS